MWKEGNIVENYITIKTITFPSLIFFKTLSYVLDLNEHVLYSPSQVVV